MAQGGDTVDHIEIFNPNTGSFGFDLYCEWSINWLKY